MRMEEDLSVQMRKKGMRVLRVAACAIRAQWGWKRGTDGTVPAIRRAVMVGCD